MLVTGGNRGIGLAIAQAFAAQGDKVAVTHRSPVTDLPEGLLAVPLRRHRRRRRRRRVRHGRGRARAGAGAGVQRRHHRRRAADADERGVVHPGPRRQPHRRLPGRQARAAGMLKARARPDDLRLVGGRAGRRGRAGQLRGVARPGWSGWPGRWPASWVAQITANVVAPGFVDTDMTAALPDARRAEILAQVPLGRYATPEEVAAVVTWLGLRRRRLRHRRGHPGRRRPRHGPLSGTETNGRDRHGTAGRQAAAGHRRHHRRLDRVPRREARAGAGRAGRAHRVRPAARWSSGSPSGCPQPAPVVELDVTNQEQLDSLADRVARASSTGLDGVLHSIGFAPETCLGEGAS